MLFFLVRLSGLLFLPNECVTNVLLFTACSIMTSQIGLLKLYINSGVLKNEYHNMFFIAWYWMKKVFNWYLYKILQNIFSEQRNLSLMDFETHNLVSIDRGYYSCIHTSGTAYKKLIQLSSVASFFEQHCRTISLYSDRQLVTRGAILFFTCCECGINEKRETGRRIS